MIILDILVVILVVILILILLILFVPFEYSIEVTNHEKDFYCRARVNWLFGLLQLAYDNRLLLHLRLFGKLVKIKNMENRKNTEEMQAIVPKKNEKKSRKKRKATKEGVKYLVKCSMGTIRKYRPKKLVVIGLLGFKDPSITGCLQGLIHVFKPPLDMENLNFIYDKKVYDGTIYTHGKMPLYYLVFVFLKLILYSPTREMLK
jgi:hypothetical protein